MLQSALDMSCQGDRYPAINLTEVNVTLCGERILKDLTLCVPEGRVTAVVGPSGAGKSTLLKAVTGLVKTDSGSVFVSGLGFLNSQFALQALRKRSATIFQEHALIDRLTALENVLLGLADSRHPLSLLPWPTALKRRAAGALEQVGILHLATRRTGSLSGGERQRVGIARALVRRPRLILGDEPFASVDPALSRRIGGIFRNLTRKNGITALVVLHQLDLARELADHVVGLNNGRIVFEGGPGELSPKAEKLIFQTPAA